MAPEGDNGEKHDHKVSEEHRAISGEIEKTQNANSCSRISLLLSPLLPPNNNVDVAKATVAMSAVTMDHELEVLLFPYFIF